jgi:ankyrin repeat protein
MIEFLSSSYGLTLEDLGSAKNLFENAVLNQNIEIVKFLVKRGFTLEDIRANDNYILRLAVYLNDFEMVKFLIEQGLTLEDIRSSIVNAISSGSFEILNLLISQGLTLEDLKSNNIYMDPIVNGNINVVKLLVSHGLTLDDLKINNNYAIKHAAGNGHVEMVKFLISQGLTIDDLISDDNYSIKTAVCLGHFEMVKFLISQGLTNVEGSHGNYIDYYPNDGHAKIVDFFLWSGLEIGDDTKTYCNFVLVHLSENNLTHVFKLFYEIYIKYNLTGFYLENIVNKNILKYLASKGYKNNESSFENVYLI